MKNTRLVMSQLAGKNQRKSFEIIKSLGKNGSSVYSNNFYSTDMRF